MSKNTYVSWSSRWTFIMAATGSAVGLGNIWKFPYITGEYGGGAFVLVYLLCIFSIGIPVMMAEVMLGRAGRSNPIDSMAHAARESQRSKLWQLIGVGGVIGGLMIMMFYSVVAGWTLEYVMQSLTASYEQDNAQAIGQRFSQLTASFSTQLGWHSLFTLITVAVVAGGVTRGIGKTVEILMPLLFILLLILLGYSIATGDFTAAVNFMFSADFSKLNAEAILVAMGHAFFTLSLGMGAIMAYGSYMPEHASIGKTVIAIAALDTLIALIAGLAIFPLIFANQLEPGSGPGLMFISLPIAFSKMAYGMVFGSAFFLLVSIAALSSSISLIEPGVAWLEKKGIKRPLAALMLATTTWCGGVMSIYSGKVFDALDFITTNILLPLGGLLIAIFAGWYMRKNFVRQHFHLRDGPAFELWYWCVRVVAPIGIGIVFIYNLQPLFN